jgi:hypothetical protein
MEDLQIAVGDGQGAPDRMRGIGEKIPADGQLVESEAERRATIESPQGTPTSIRGAR